jgi:hypothetical protein
VKENRQNLPTMKKELRLSQVLHRELSGKVLSRVAKEVGISTSVLHDWHSSARKPAAKNLWQLRKLADYLGLSLEEILFDEKTKRTVVCSEVFSDQGIHYRLTIERIK